MMAESEFAFCVFTARKTFVYFQQFSLFSVVFDEPFNSISKIEIFNQLSLQFYLMCELEFDRYVGGGEHDCVGLAAATVAAAILRLCDCLSRSSSKSL